MKKIIFIILLLLPSTTSNYFKWEPTTSLFKKNLKIGDIIIRKKGSKPIEWFGHVAILGDNNNIIEFPNYKSGYNYVSLDSWVENSRDIILLRYNSDIENKKILKEIYKHQEKKYGVLHKKESSEKFYCSQFIWYIYFESLNVDLLNRNYNVILPYDFLYSNKLKQI